MRLKLTAHRRQRAKTGRTIGPEPRQIASLPQDPDRFTGHASVTTNGITVRLTPSATNARAYAAAHAAVIDQAKSGIRHDADGWPIVVPFDDDEGFCTHLNRLVRTVHARWPVMARVFDEQATALRLRLRLDEKRHQAATDAHALATAYAEHGTAAMTGLAAQIRQRMVADALAGAR